METDAIVTMDAITDAMGKEGKEFLEVMQIVNMIVADPSAFSAKRAAQEAGRLAGLRTIIGVKAQYYKTAERSIANTKRKNVLLTLYNALEENINTMKLLSRIGNDIL